PPGETGDIDGLLADDLALSGESDAADFWRHARSAGPPAVGRRRAAVAAARSGVGAAREPDADASCGRAHRAHRPARPGIGLKGKVALSRRRGRSVECNGRVAADTDHVAG